MYHGDKDNGRSSLINHPWFTLNLKQLVIHNQILGVYMDPTLMMMTKKSEAPAGVRFKVHVGHKWHRGRLLISKALSHENHTLIPWLVHSYYSHGF